MSLTRDLIAKKPWDFAAEEKKHAGWITIAQRVVNGDYSKADGSTRTSLTIGLRGYPDDICQRAVEILKKYER